MFSLVHLLIVTRDRNVKVIERERPEGRVQLAAHVLPHFRRMERLRCFNHRLHDVLAGKKIVILEKRETFNVNHNMALVKFGTVSFPGLSLANKRARARRFNHMPVT